VPQFCGLKPDYERGTEMREGDGAAIEDERVVAIEADNDAEFLLFDLG
jgi:hypothetical protein